MTDQTDLTPLEKLGVAVETYVREVEADDGEEDGSIVSGFIVAIQMQRYQSDPAFAPIQTSSSYAASLGTTGETMLGLLRLTQLRVEEGILASDDEDD
jgi:hypothetical protein